MKCPNCGQISRVDREFCALCGAPLKKEKKGLWTGIAVAVLLLAGLALFLLWPRDKAPDDSVTPEPETVVLTAESPEPARELPQAAVLWTGAREIYVSHTYTLALMQDGTLRLAGQGLFTEFGLDVEDWANVVQVLPRPNLVAALTGDGRVLLTGQAYDYAAAAQWSGVTRLVWSANTLFGLTGNGRLLAAGPAVNFDTVNFSEVERLVPGSCDTLAVTSDGSAHVLPYMGMVNDADRMSGIAAMAVNSEFALYLLTDGRVYPSEGFRSSPYDWLNPYGSWQNVTDLQLGDWGCLALTADGRVLSTPLIADGQAPDTTAWADVAQLVYDKEHNAAFGVTVDGRVLASCPGGLLPFPEVAAWTDVAELQVNWNYAVARTTDGRVLTACTSDAPAAFDTADWLGVSAIALGESHLAALTGDGRVLVTGDNSFGQCG